MTERELILSIIKGEKPERFPEWGHFAWTGTPAEHSMTFPESGPDWFGVQWFVAPDKTQVPQPGFKRFPDMSVWKEANCIPNVDVVDWKKFGEDLAPKWNDQVRHESVTMMHDASGHFERLHYLIGFEDSLMAFYFYPDETKELFHEITKLKIATIERLAEYVKPDIYCPHDDWGTNLNMFFSPEIWREFIKPELKQVVDACHAHGMIFDQHTCGHVTPVFEDLMEIGVDVVECQSCNDFSVIKKHGNKLVIDGAVNSQVITKPGVTEEEARQCIRETIYACAEGGGYLGSTLGIPAARNLPIRKVCAEEFDKYARDVYGYTGNMSVDPLNNK